MNKILTIPNWLIVFPRLRESFRAFSQYTRDYLPAGREVARLLATPEYMYVTRTVGAWGQKHQWLCETAIDRLELSSDLVDGEYLCRGLTE